MRRGHERAGNVRLPYGGKSMALYVPISIRGMCGDLAQQMVRNAVRDIVSQWRKKALFPWIFVILRN